MLPSMNESLESFKSQAPYSLGTVVHVSNCSTWNVKTERYEFKAILSYIWSWEINLRHVKACLKKNKEKKKERKGWVWLCFHYSFNYSTHETEAGQQLSLNRGQPHLHIELLASQGYKWHRLKFKKCWVTNLRHKYFLTCPIITQRGRTRIQTQTWGKSYWRILSSKFSNQTPFPKKSLL